MSTIPDLSGLGPRDLHNEALALTDKAHEARRVGDEDLAQEHYIQAFYRETEAAKLLQPWLHNEPRRSTLFRGAATLACECQMPEEAERLICTALLGNPTRQLATELRGLLRDRVLPMLLETDR